MTCAKTKGLIGPYIFGDVSTEEAHLVRSHAQECRSCRDDIREQMSICNALDNRVPELSDEEISRIKWYVKGAVSDCKKVQSFNIFHLVPAFSMVLFLILGFAFGRWIGYGHKSPQHNVTHAVQPILQGSDNNAASSASKKEKVPAVPNKSDKTAKTEKDDSGTISPTTADYYRLFSNATRDIGSTGVATTRQGRSSKRPKIIILDQPLPLVSEPDANNSEVSPDENKLPEPSTLNNMEKTEPAPEE